jgi:HD-GYP domain-containing protein (c-di-GMP phosphodiesterase class II)
MDDQIESRLELAAEMVRQGYGPLVIFDSLPRAVDSLERDTDLDLAVCLYRGNDSTLLQKFVDLTTDIPTLLFVKKKKDLAGISLEGRTAPLEWSRRPGAEEFRRSLGKLRDAPEEAGGRDEDFLQVSLQALNIVDPIPVDVYLRLGTNHFIKRFSKTDGFTAEDLEICRRKLKLPYLYFRKSQAEAVLGEKVAGLGRLLNEERIPPEELRAAGEDSLEIIHDVVTQVGFPPKTEELVKRTVALVIKAMGASPELTGILNQVRKHEGKYISSHSFMLAELACAVTHKLGLSSGSTFMKLTIAALLHDLSLADGDQARIRNLEKAEAFDAETQKRVKLHPIHAAELARKLKELPADVDSILAQHHERPDGKGFPRGLFHHQINLLAAIFIVSHDLLDFYLDRLEGAAQSRSLSAFLHEMGGIYPEGNFEKIINGLASGVFEPEPQS